MAVEFGDVVPKGWNLNTLLILIQHTYNDLVS